MTGSAPSLPFSLSEVRIATNERVFFDGSEIYTAEDLRVGLFTSTDDF